MLKELMTKIPNKYWNTVSSKSKRLKKPHTNINIKSHRKIWLSVARKRQARNYSAHHTGEALNGRAIRALHGICAHISAFHTDSPLSTSSDSEVLFFS